MSAPNGGVLRPLRIGIQPNYTVHIASMNTYINPQQRKKMPTKTS